LNVLLILLSVAVLAFCSQLLVAPFLVYSRARHPARPTVRELGPEEPPWTPPFGFDYDIVGMELLGFTVAAHLVQDQESPGIRSLITLFTNREELTAAIIVYPQIDEIGQATFKEFATTFEDGPELCCNDSNGLGVFARAPEKRTYSFPHVKDLSDLYRIHQRLLETEGSSRRRTLPAPGEEFAVLCAELAHDLARQADRGYFRLDREADRYRPTIKGAVVMTWKLAWPVKPIRQFLIVRKGKRIVRKLGIALDRELERE
jgi:hypothetical protein